MVTVSKSVLKAKMLEYLRQVEETGEELIVTDNGVPVVRVVPFQARASVDEVFGDVRGRIVYREDVLASTAEEWPEA
jgi:prevent-host-death family protein